MIDYLELLLDRLGQEMPEETPGMELGVPSPVEAWKSGKETSSLLHTLPGSENKEQTAGGGGDAPGSDVQAELAPAETMDRSETAERLVRRISGRVAGDLLEAAASIKQAGARTVNMSRVGQSGGVAAEGERNERAVSDGGDAPDEVRSEAVGAGEIPAASLWTALWRGQGRIPSTGGVGVSVENSGLYRQMVRAGQAVGGLRQNARTLSVTENTTPVPAPGAAELDEIFARDARRYDSGFSLY